MFYLCLHERCFYPEASPEASDKLNMSFFSRQWHVFALGSDIFISAVQMQAVIFFRSLPFFEREFRQSEGPCCRDMLDNLLNSQ